MDTVSFQELTGWLRLALTPGVGDLTARRLLAAFGLPETVFSQSAANLRQVVARPRSQPCKTLPQNGRRLVTRFNDGWIRRLFID